MRSLVFAFAALLLAATQTHAQCSASQAGCISTPNGYQPGPGYQGPRPLPVPTQQPQQQIIQPQMTLCPDGNWVMGQCYLAPNGRWIGR